MFCNKSTNSKDALGFMGVPAAGILVLLFAVSFVGHVIDTDPLQGIALAVLLTVGTIVWVRGRVGRPRQAPEGRDRRTGERTPIWPGE
jgi:hypothetical protein